MKKIIYMDNAATTSLLPEVLDSMMPYLKEKYGNASSIHSMGYEAKMGIIRAKEQIGKLLECDPEKIYFTSGATESNNWIMNQNKFRFILTSNIEHPSIYSCGQYINRNTLRKVRFIDVDTQGMINENDYECKLMHYNPDLVSIMYVNNEIGVIQDIKKLNEKAKEHKALFHTDATQAIGHVPISIKDLNIDFLSASSHKIGGPKGVGLLYMNEQIDSYMIGGHQENGLRAGTYNTANIVGFGKACEIARMNLLKNKNSDLVSLQLYFIYRLKNEIIDSRINTPFNSVENNINISIKGINGEQLMMMLNDKGIICSNGSACNSGINVPSRVLEKIKVPSEYINGSLRFSLSFDNTKEEIDYVIEQLKSCVNYLRT